ncbi:uncharacterized protein [Lepeophtheirus salmonis]|uniref:uncharacterized protein n=1 Tax=Lepeophtheirus salmonis TaxID=72036 RepID=UPI001AE8178A|nr:secreted RxLR effector protein 161-like [Lepeophtheirus salmonis]
MDIYGSTFCLSILERTGFEDSKTVETPVALETKLTKVVDEEIVKPIEYRSIVGSLIYLSTRTRPDLAFAVGALAHYCDAPGSEHWVALKIILLYLKNTKNLGLCYRKSNKGELVGFSDSDWAGDHDDRKSTSGYIFLYNEGPTYILEKSKTKVGCIIDCRSRIYGSFCCITRMHLDLKFIVQY